MRARQTPPEDDARTVAYGDQEQDLDDDAQTVAYGESEEPEPLLPIHSTDPDSDDDRPAILAPSLKPSKKGVLYPSSSSSSSRGPSIAKQDIW